MIYQTGFIKLDSKINGIINNGVVGIGSIIGEPTNLLALQMASNILSKYNDIDESLLHYFDTSQGNKGDHNYFGIHDLLDYKNITYYEKELMSTEYLYDKFNKILEDKITKRYKYIRTRITSEGKKINYTAPTVIMIHNLSSLTPRELKDPKKRNNAPASTQARVNSEYLKKMKYMINKAKVNIIIIYSIINNRPTNMNFENIDKFKTPFKNMSDNSIAFFADLLLSVKYYQDVEYCDLDGGLSIEGSIFDVNILKSKLSKTTNNNNSIKLLFNSSQGFLPYNVESITLKRKDDDNE